MRRPRVNQCTICNDRYGMIKLNRSLYRRIQDVSIVGPLARMHEWCCTVGGVMSHIWMSHVAHVYEWCCTVGGVMSHMYISHVALCRELFHT